MDLKVVCVIVCFYALTITSTEAGIPKCCVTTRREIPESFLRKVQKSEMQTNTGACNVAALILHVKGLRKPICAHPKIKTILARLRRKMKRSARNHKF